MEPYGEKLSGRSPLRDTHLERFRSTAVFQQVGDALSLGNLREHRTLRFPWRGGEGFEMTSRGRVTISKLKWPRLHYQLVIGSMLGSSPLPSKNEPTPTTPVAVEWLELWTPATRETFYRNKQPGPASHWHPRENKPTSTTPDNALYS